MKRTRETKEFWEKHLRAFRKSRMSQIAYRQALKQKQEIALLAIKQSEKVMGWMSLTIAGE